MWPLALLVGAAFLFGGGARGDIQSLLLLRPLAAAFLVFALWHHGRTIWRDHRAVMLLMIGIVLLPALHLIPLPPAWWQALPGRSGVAAFYAAADMPAPWLPISLTPSETWNALFSLALPFAVLLLALAQGSDRHVVLLRALLIVGMVSGLLGLVQAIGPARGPLYLYRITNEGMAVGLFANRNHQAMLLGCLFPLLAAHVSLMTAKREQILLHKAIAVSAAAFLIPLILVTGSRSGLLGGAVGLALAFWVYCEPLVTGRTILMQTSKRASYGALAAVGVLVFGLVLSASVRAPAVDRLLVSDVSEDLRWRALPTLWRAAVDYFPVGSGIGSFVQTYKLIEPRELLSARYFNHAHNEPLELLLTGGLPAVVLLVAAFALWVLGTMRAVRTDVRRPPMRAKVVLARTGTAILLLLAIGSLGDYPLRVPSLACLAAIAAAWMAVGGRPEDTRTSPATGSES